MSPKLTSTSGDRSQCGACGLYFTSTCAFDSHRKGKHGVNRHCLREAELRAKGFEPNERGFWRQPCADRGALLRDSPSCGVDA